MNCHTHHIHHGAGYICLVLCSICLCFCAVQGLSANDKSKVNKRDLQSDNQLLQVAHHKKRELPFSPIESQATPSSHTAVQPTSPDISHDALQKLFAKYGENNMITFEGFEKLLKSIGLQNIVLKKEIDIGSNTSKATGDSLDPHDHDNEDHETHDHDDHSSHSDFDAKASVSVNDSVAATTGNNSAPVLTECPSSDQLLPSSGVSVKKHLTVSDFNLLCPTLIYYLDTKVCGNHDHHDHGSHDHDGHDHSSHNETAHSTKSPSYSLAVWGYSFIACLVISGIGLLAVAIIPIMGKVIYNHLLHFLVALAIGSLSGDALLHLLPHAVIPHVHGHDEVHSNETGHVLEHEIHDHSTMAQRKAVWCGLTALAGILLFFIVERLVGFWSEKRHAKHESKQHDPNLSKSSNGPMLSSKDHQKKLGAKLHHHSHTSCEEMVIMVHPNKDVRKMADDAHDEMHKNCDGTTGTDDSNWGQTFDTGGHHHSHEVPKSVAAVAWVVIFGDGLHNFADGLAIGSAFANSLTGGLSTSIAVICHELPHELGDFAMLLKAGMSARKALIYNCISSVLCAVGMVIGIALGNIASVNPWIFSIIAGMFLYIALVDMLPEMKSVDPRKGEHPLIHFGLQLAGMLTGSMIMLLIALFEDQIHLE